MSKPGHAHLPAWLVSAAASSLVLGLLAAGPAQAATVRSPAAPAASHETAGRPAGDKPAAAGGQSAAKASQADFKPAACALAPKDAGSKVFARCFALVRTNLEHQMLVSPDQPPSGALGPADIQSAYNLNPAGGAGKTIAIVDAYGYVNAESDLATFRSYYGLPPCTTANGCFSKLDENGGTNYPPDGNGWSLEQALDLDSVSSVCPNCHITLVQATTNSVQDLGTAVDTAAGLPGVVAISNSYGVEGEFSGEQSYDSYYDHPGIAVDAATGDTGDEVNWPASGDDVLAVGGTTLTQDPSVPRGWTESAWADGGSGCSQYEPQPAYQAGINTDCPDNKATADISADANPDSGLAVYDTDAADGYSGWYQVGGTSLATPLISGMFGLAANPVPGTYPVTYPYADPDQSSDLNDITTGSNGSCGTVLCNAGPGWDGPTGLGTPNGVGALDGVTGAAITGTVESGGAPVAGATVTATDASDGENVTATTDSAGTYSLPVLPGTYTVTASMFGYKPQTAGGVVVGQGATVTQDFTLRTVPSHTLSGTVTDGSGHKWPMYAKITISGYPGRAIYTDPFSGRYSVSLPQGGTYALSVTAASMPGYMTSTATVKIGTAGKTKNIKLDVDQTACSAPGYAWKYQGVGTDFEGWQGTTPQDGWTNVDNDGSGYVWDFDDASGNGNLTGGTGQFAEADVAYPSPDVDASLISPVVNLSKQTDPQIMFDTYASVTAAVADVDLSLNGGQTWSNVWEQPNETYYQGPVDIDIPQAAGDSDVQVRFHYTHGGSGDLTWQLDDVVIGSTPVCAPARGGLVEGLVSDGNTGAAIDGATVASNADAAGTGTSAATPDDPNLPDGYYWLFSSATGETSFTATSDGTHGAYTPATATVDVTANGVTRQDWALQAGHVNVAPGTISVTQAMGAAKTSKLTFTNTGTQSVHVQLGEEDGGFTPAGSVRETKLAGAPLQRVKGHFGPAAAALQHPSSPARHDGGAVQTRDHVTRRGLPAAADASWAPITDYPVPVLDNEAAYNSSNGDVYSVGGYDGSSGSNTADGWMYDPAAGSWSPIADAPAGLEASTGAFINGVMYVVGGWDSASNSTNTVYAYNAGSNTWSQVADLPEEIAGAASAVVNGQLYIVGGCTNGGCSPESDAVYSYDPASNTWTQQASYPAGQVTDGACAGLDGELVCAGGVNSNAGTSYDSTWIYDPGSSTWTQGADMPYDDWGAAYAGANGMLEIADGVTSNSTEVTNQAAAYDPSSNTWTALPNTSQALYEAGGSCGMYTVGGNQGEIEPVEASEQLPLPGYDQCGTVDVPWLSDSQSAFSVAPGQTVHVTVTLDSSAVSQPGTYTADLIITTDSPYDFSPVAISMRVNPPPGWGEITGTVTAAATGDPIPGATVQICTLYDTTSGACGPVTYTLTTGEDGTYQLWLDKGYNPLQVDVSADGYQPAFKVVKITARNTTTVNFALSRA